LRHCFSLQKCAKIFPETACDPVKTTAHIIKEGMVMRVNGAGGTKGGAGSFFIGFFMMCAGIYLLLQAISVTSPFGMGFGLYSFGAFGSSYSVTSGMIMIPFIIGVGMIFFNDRNYLGWSLAVGALISLLAGVIMNIHFTFRSMSLFDLIVILILSFGGLGLFLSSLRNHESN
jgi:hypothetical protein